MSGKIKPKVIKIIISILILFSIFLLFELFKPTWTPKIKGENSISELRKIEINSTDLEVMIRGNDKKNPVIIFVHGGPGCPEMPYVRKYQNLLEKNFTIVHYDQRCSGKSYNFKTDYSNLTSDTHVNDLIELTKYVEKYLKQDKVILIGHSYGTYLSTMAVNKSPELYKAYVGIGQVSDVRESEIDGLNKCIEVAKLKKDTEAIKYLEDSRVEIEEGKNFTPREYLNEYGFKNRKIDENKDLFKGFLVGPEYNLMDGIRYNKGAASSTDKITLEVLNNNITDIVKEIDIPVYFIMGKHDGLTSPKLAEKYLNSLNVKGKKEMVIFEDSAHYPQFEEKEKFYQWMCKTFIK